MPLAARVPVALLAGLALLAGCYHAGAPSRSAETAAQGKFRFRETFNVVSAGRGTVTFPDRDLLIPI